MIAHNCPYMLLPLADLHEIDREQIIPVALAVNASFSVRADKLTNSKLGNGIDEFKI